MDTEEAKAQGHLTASVTHLHDATICLLRVHNAGAVRALAEDIGAHRNAIQRLAEALSRYRSTTDRATGATRT